jgi:glutathione S-transferase
MVNLLVDTEEAAIYLGKKFGVPDTLIRDEAERKQMQEMMQQMAAMQQQGGGPV